MNISLKCWIVWSNPKDIQFSASFLAFHPCSIMDWSLLVLADSNCFHFWDDTEEEGVEGSVDDLF